MTAAIAFIVLFFAGIMLFGMHQEGVRWNNGACPQCGCAWQSFDTDSSGARGYKCSNGCNETIWISYNFDR